MSRVEQLLTRRYSQPVGPALQPAGCNAGRAWTSVLVVLELGRDVGGDVDVGEDVLHVVEVLERVGELEHLDRGVLVDGDLHAGHELDVGRVIVDRGSLESGAYGDH